MESTLRAIIVTILLIFAFHTEAEESRIYINDFAIAQGETKTVEIHLDNPDFTPSGIYGRIYLSGGLTLVEKGGRCNLSLTSRIPDLCEWDQFTGRWNSSSYVVMLNFFNTHISGTSGPIFTMQVTTDDTFGTTSEPPAIKLSSMYMIDYEYKDIYDLDSTIAYVHQPVSMDNMFDPANEGQTCFVADPLKIIASINDPQGATHAFASNGWQWLKLYYPDGNPSLIEGATLEGGNVGGVLSDLSSNPTIHIDHSQSYPLASTSVNIDPLSYDISDAPQLTPNEVIGITGFYFVDNGQPYISAFSGNTGSRGTTIALNTDWCVNANFTQQQYEFSRVVVQKRTTPHNSPRKAGGNTSAYADYELCVLGYNSAIVTGMDDIDIEPQAVDTKYYNNAGVESITPHQGMNMVVTIHSDGSRTTSKVVY